MKRIVSTLALLVALAFGTGLPTSCGGGGEGTFSGLWDFISNACSPTYEFADTLNLSLRGTTTAEGDEFEVYEATADGFDTYQMLISAETGEVIFCIDPADTLDFAECLTFCFGFIDNDMLDFSCLVGPTDFCGPVTYDRG